MNDDIWADLRESSKPRATGWAAREMNQATRKMMEQAARGSKPEQESTKVSVDPWILTSGIGSIRTGRSDSGNLRNFKAMSEEKLEGVINAVVREDNDPEAMIALLREVARRYT